jgi:hypothetical protein
MNRFVEPLPSTFVFLHNILRTGIKISLLYTHKEWQGKLQYLPEIYKNVLS